MRHLAALGAVKLAGAHHLLQLLLELYDAILQQSSVGLDLSFTRTTHEARTTALALKVGPASDEAALLVVQMREINLQRAFLGGGAAAEDFKDETRAVDDLGIPLLFEISLLHRGQRMIDDHQAGIRLIEQMANFLDLAGSEQCRRARLVHRNDETLRHLQIDGERQTLGFLKLGFNGTAGSDGACRRIAIFALLLEDGHEDNRAHVVAALFLLRNDRFVRSVARRNGLSLIQKEDCGRPHPRGRPWELT
ncbi:hypothetical protein D3C72_1056380 [compost metagenome]